MIPADTENSTPAPVALTKKTEAYCAASGASEPTHRPFGIDTTLTDRMNAAVAHLEALAAEIVRQLDALDGDPDLEPVLGAPEPVSGRSTERFSVEIDQRQWSRGGDVDEREPMADDEFALGGLGDALDQHRWAQQGTDIEEEHDGREPEPDEHNLGRSETIDQTRFEVGADDLEWSLGSSNPISWDSQEGWGDVQAGIVGGDAEWQCEDEGHDSDSEAEAGEQCANYESHDSQLHATYVGVY